MTKKDGSMVYVCVYMCMDVYLYMYVCTCMCVCMCQVATVDDLSIKKCLMCKLIKRHILEQLSIN